MRRATTLATQSVVVLGLTLIAVVALYPIVFMFLSSFKTSVEYVKDPIGLPAGLTYVDNFRAMFIRFEVARLLLNSALYIALSAVLSLAVAIPASFAFAKLRFPGRAPLRTMMIATLIVPAITFIVPSYIMMANLHLVDSYWSVVLIWSA